MAATKALPLVTAPVLTCVACNCKGAYLECCVCGSCYCSVECQRNTWPQHREVCMPRLILAPMCGRSLHLTQFPPPPIPQQQTARLSKDASNNAPFNRNVKPPETVPEIRMPNTPPKAATGNGAAKPSVPSGVQKAPPNPSPGNGTALNGEAPVLQKTQKMAASIATKVNAANAETQKKLLPGNDGKKPVPSPVQKLAPEIVQTVPAAGSKPEANKVPKPSATSIALKLNAEKYATNAEADTIGSMLCQGPFPEPGKRVQIAHVADDKMYIYETGPGPNGEPNQFLSLIKSCIEHACQVKELCTVAPSVDDIVFAPFDGDYYRAVVKSIGGDSVKVFYPDFGNTQTVAWNTLKEISDPRVKYANSVTHPVWVDHVSSFTKPMQRFLESLVDSAEFELRTVIAMPKSTVRIVDMFHVKERYVLSDKLLALRGDTTAATKTVELKTQPKANVLVVTNPITYKPVMVEELIHAEDLNDAKDVELVILNATSAITDDVLSVATKSRYAQYEAMMQECKLYGQIDPNPYRPDGNEMCLVMVKDTWYRAIMLDNDDDAKPNQFYLVDISELIEAEGAVHVRRYPPGLTRKLYLSECILENCDMLLEAADGREENLANLRGTTFIGDLVRMAESGDTHITIKSFS